MIFILNRMIRKWYLWGFFELERERDSESEKAKERQRERDSEREAARDSKTDRQTDRDDGMRITDAPPYTCLRAIRSKSHTSPLILNLSIYIIFQYSRDFTSNNNILLFFTEIRCQVPSRWDEIVKYRIYPVLINIYTCVVYGNSNPKLIVIYRWFG